MKRLCLIGLAACFSIPPRPQGAGDGGADADSSDSGSANNRMFVTSGARAGTLVTTVAAADQMCSEAAAAATLPGTYVAWMSFLDTVDAIDRLQGHRGWRRVDGEPFVDTVADLVAGRMFAPPRIDEYGHDAYSDFAYVMTGTDSTGRANGQDCAHGAETRMGFNDAGHPIWTDNTAIACSTDMHVYCFGTDRDAPLVVEKRTPVAFLSSQLVLSNVAGLDRQCMDDAAGANVPGMFRAAVAMSGESAASRVSMGQSRVWYRVDGTPVATSAGTSFLAPLDVDAHGIHVPGVEVYFGSQTWAGLGVDNCEDWTPSSGLSTMTGDPRRSSAGAFSGASLRVCDSPQRVYCFQTD